MQINCVIELSMVLDSDKFHKLFARALDRNGYMEGPMVPDGRR